jgi:SAM-dependent methyltransferase
VSDRAHPADELSAYLDGDLDTSAARAVAEHLAACSQCRAVVDDLERLRAAARAWATDAAAPSADLWPGIAARLAGAEAAPSGAMRTSSRAPVTPIRWYRRRVSLGLAELALAASVVAALGGALLYQRQAVPATPQAPAPIVAQVEPFDAPDADVATVNFADVHYDAAILDLERVLQEQRQHLNPRTVLVLERNLRIIDDAVREARAALAVDPANPLLNAQLADVRRRKLQLLRRAALIIEGD